MNKGGNKMKKFLGLFVLLLFVLNVSAFDFNLDKQDSGLLSGLEGSVLSLSVDGVNEVKMTIDRVGTQRIMTTLTPGDSVLVIDLDQSKEIDLDKDGVSDIKLTLNNIIDRLASFKIEKIIVNGEENLENTTTNGLEDLTGNVVDDLPEVVIEDVTQNTISSMGGYGKWLVGGVIGVIILVILVFLFKDGDDSEKMYNKAMDLHREGQEFHWDGDDETAEELYDKAGEVREKARDVGGF
jgi:hypothetical protein